MLEHETKQQESFIWKLLKWPPLGESHESFRLKIEIRQKKGILNESAKRNLRWQSGMKEDSVPISDRLMPILVTPFFYRL